MRAHVRSGMRPGLFALVAFVACSEVTSDPGTDALLQVKGAQFRRGALPAENGGPGVQNFSSSQLVNAGANDLAGSGSLDRSANAIAVALDGDVGWWSVPAAVPDVYSPLAPTFNFAFGLSPALSSGTHTLTTRAVDGDGHFGAAELHTLEVVGRDVPAGILVVSLAWDTGVDLDLHVVLPTGVEVWKGRPAEYQPPSVSEGATDPLALRDGGILDHDSNAHCQEDGQRGEDAVWKNPPPPGHYLVRVDTFSMCGDTHASWRAEARLNGQRIGSASGTATEADMQFPHGRGFGLLAFEFDVP